MLNKERQSNIELLRIFAMFAIVASHYLTFGIINGISSNVLWYKNNTFHKISAFIFCNFLGGGNCSVAIFFMITGFFKINDDRIRLSKTFKQVFFYSLFCKICSSFALIL